MERPPHVGSPWSATQSNSRPLFNSVQPQYKSIEQFYVRCSREWLTVRRMSGFEEDTRWSVFWNDTGHRCSLCVGTVTKVQIGCLKRTLYEERRKYESV